MDCLCGRPLGTNRGCSFCRDFKENMHVKEKMYDTESERPYRAWEEV